MAQRDEIIRFANELLEIDRFPEYGTPGLQVVGADEVTKIACGVSSSKELFERAAAAGAQLVIVHHGMFWRNEPVWIDRRQRGRLEALFAATSTSLRITSRSTRIRSSGTTHSSPTRSASLESAPFGDVGIGGSRASRRRSASSSRGSRTSSAGASPSSTHTGPRRCSDSPSARAARAAS